jgi:hypothetical protein
MNNLRPKVTLLAIACVAITACGQAAVPSRITDPREAVVQALRSTAALEAVHALVRVEARERGGQSYLVTIEGDVNVASRELSVTAKLEPALFGVAAARLVLAGGFGYSSTDGGSWSVFGGPGQDPLASVPTTAQIAMAVEGAIRDPATSVVLEGTEACAEATCLRIRAEVPVDVAWRAVNEILSTPTRQGATLAPPPASFPGIGIDLWIEQDTLRLRQATNMTVVESQSISITVALSHHGEPVTIRAPVAR